MNDRERTYRRTSVMSYPRAQCRIIVVFGLLALLFAAANWYMSRDALRRLTLRVLSQRGLSAAACDDVRITYEQEKTTLNIQLAGFTFLSLMLLVSGGVYLSHKIAGPIFHLNKYLQEVTAGRSPTGPMHFRKHDFFPELADNFNAFQRSQGLLPDPAADSGPGPKDGPRA